MINKTIETIKEQLEACDAILIGAGAGLSTAAGLDYGGQRFLDLFSDYKARYGLTDMYSAAFYPFKTLEEKWAYFSRHIMANYYNFTPNDTYQQLRELVNKKPHFVMTTNADRLFYKSGFKSEVVFAPQGDYRKFQCEKGCHNNLYNNYEVVNQMVNQQKAFKIPTDLIPYCPVCGEPLVPHLRIDGHFVESEDWELAQQRYLQFLNKWKNKKMVLLELGVGFNTPGIIRIPFEQMALDFQDAFLVRINKNNIDNYYPNDHKNSLIKDDIQTVINNLS